jgi:hypothetical protein
LKSNQLVASARRHWREGKEEKRRGEDIDFHNSG